MKLPRAEKVKKEAKLYPVTITEEKCKGDRAIVKMHYEGYSGDSDEWRYEEELENLNHYQDLNHLLGSCWHFRGLNVNGDYGYVLLDAVDFSPQKARSLVEYLW